MGMLFFALLLFVSVAPFSFSEAASWPSPPVAKKVKHEMTMFGDVRNDDYYWLRDDSRTNSEVLAYLEAENNYTESVMSGSKHSQEKLFAELRGRITEDDMSLPVRHGQYYYYIKYFNGLEHFQFCRRFNPNSNTPPTVYETMPTGPDAPKEQILLDIRFRDLANDSVLYFAVSDDDKFVAYSEDTKGGGNYTVHIIYAENGTSAGEPLIGVTAAIEWAGNDTLAYMTANEIPRPEKVWLHKVGSAQSSDLLIYHEKDDDISDIYFELSGSSQYLFILTISGSTQSVFYLDLFNLDKGLAALTVRAGSMKTSASHRGNYFFIQRTSDELFNSEIVVCPVNNISDTKVVLPHRESVQIVYFNLFMDHLVIYGRENGLPILTIYDLPNTGETIEYLKNGRSLNFSDPSYTVGLGESQFSSAILRFYYTSFRTPKSEYDYDMKTGVSVLKKIDMVHGGFNASNYASERLLAVSPDGTRIPISTIYRRELVKLDGSNPLVLHGSGSDGEAMDPYFNTDIFSLLDRGVIYAIAHVRGGGEFGGNWYNDGKLLKKNNTFADFISCAEYLIENKYTSKEKLCSYGEGEGGLLTSVVANMLPDLFKVVVAKVPFVDVLTTMLDPRIPITTSEYEEFGDPHLEKFYFYIKSYSPVDNVKSQSYPYMFFTAGLYDSNVIYSEPAKFVAKLRDTKKDDNIILFKCQFEAGYLGRYTELRETALIYTFILKSLGMIPYSI